jgi:hypothetical protein
VNDALLGGQRRAKDPAAFDAPVAAGADGRIERASRGADRVEEPLRARLARDTPRRVVDGASRRCILAVE